MAKPLTKGPPVSFRLPLAVDAKLRVPADAAGVTVEAVVAKLCERVGDEAIGKVVASLAPQQGVLT